MIKDLIKTLKATYFIVTLVISICMLFSFIYLGWDGYKQIIKYNLELIDAKMGDKKNDRTGKKKK